MAAESRFAALIPLESIGSKAAETRFASLALGGPDRLLARLVEPAVIVLD